MNRTLSILAPAGAIALVSAGMLVIPSGPALACGEDSLVGSVCYTAASYCPQGMYPAQGAEMSFRNDMPLYSLISTLYGGTQNVTFKLPNLAGRAPIGVNSGTSLNQKLSEARIASIRGTTTGQLLAENMPWHTHAAVFSFDPAMAMPKVTLLATSGPGSSNIPSTTTSTIAGLSGAASPMWAPSLDSPVALEGASVAVAGGFTGGTVTNSASGEGNVFSIQPPSMVLTACIVGGNGGFPYPMRP